MESDDTSSIWARTRRILLGGARDPHDPNMFHHLSLIAFFAWVGLGADGLSSSCYGPPEAFLALKTHPHLAMLVAVGTAITILVISIAYSQIIRLFPSGGGGYLVASHLLNPTVGMISGCALLVDYVLTISLSIASGTDAIFSYFPPSWYPHRLWFAVFGVLLLIGMNMRGIKESVVPLLPVFMLFVITHVIAIAYVLCTHVDGLMALPAETVHDFSSARSELGFFGVVFLLFRAYSMGAGTYTGIEAVSNGLPILREPRVQTGRRTMGYMAGSLIVAVMGLMIAYQLCHVEFVEGKTLNAVLLEDLSNTWPSFLRHPFIFLTLFSEGAILLVAAQTGFLDGPRVLANMAIDRWLPNRFALLSDRLVTQNGVLMMGGAALTILVLARGSVDYLIVLYSINVFITFTLSQLSMVRHWWQVRGSSEPWKHGMFINGLGLLMTGGILVSVVFMKFGSGGWITLVVTGALVAVALGVRRHYEHTRTLLKRLDDLVAVTEIDIKPGETGEGAAAESMPCDARAQTAIVLVNGYNGLGLHTLFGIIRHFKAGFRNFVFVQVGVVDAGNFKGVDELERLKQYIDGSLNRYVGYMQRQGFYAEKQAAIGADAVEEIVKLIPKLRERFPDSICFAGQLVFPEESVFTRFLHNYIVFAVQRRLYMRGIPLMILPIRV
jgi:amino acid transporter